MTATALPARFRLPPSFVNYQLDTAYDEMFASPGAVREHYRALQQTLLGLEPEELRQSQQAADLAFLHEGITFTVYGEQGRHGAHLSQRSSAAHHPSARVDKN